MTRDSLPVAGDLLAGLPRDEPAATVDDHLHTPFRESTRRTLIADVHLQRLVALRSNLDELGPATADQDLGVHADHPVAVTGHLSAAERAVRTAIPAYIAARYSAIEDLEATDVDDWEPSTASLREGETRDDAHATAVEAQLRLARDHDELPEE